MSATSLFEKGIDQNGDPLVLASAFFVKTVPGNHDPVPCRYGHKITLIGRVNDRIDDEQGAINEFRTGLKVSAPCGYMFEMKCEPGLTEAGYCIAPGDELVFDTSDELIVRLLKFGKGNDLSLPLDCIRLLLREANNFHLATLAQPSKVQGQQNARRGFNTHTQFMQAHNSTPSAASATASASSFY